MVNHVASELAESLRRTPVPTSRRDLERRWSRPAFRSAANRGLIVAVAGSIYAAAEHAESLSTRAHAATQWFGQGTLLTGSAAAHAWGLLDEAPRQICVSAPPGRKRQGPEWLVATCTGVRPPQAEWFGCPIAMPAWAIVSAFGAEPDDVGNEMVYRAVRERLVTTSDLREVMSRMPRVRSRAALERTIAAAEAGAESHLEAIGLRNVFNTAEFSRFVRQHRVRAEGRPFRLDMFDHATLTAVELDGATVHGQLDRREADLRRDAILAGIGILTVRLSYRAVVNDPDWCRSRVRAVISARMEGGAEWAQSTHRIV